MECDLKKIAAEEIIQSRSAWLSQNGINLSSIPNITRIMKFDYDFQFIPLTYKLADLSWSEILIMSSNAGLGKTTSLLSIVQKFDAAKITASSSLIENDDEDNGSDIRATETFPSRVEDVIKSVYDLSLFDFVFYIPMRNNNFDNFNDYIKSLLPQTLGNDENDEVLDRVIEAIYLSKCLILCDGFNEANAKAQKLFEQLIGFDFSRYTFIISTRPDNIEKLTSIISNASRRARFVMIVSGLPLQDQI